MGKALENKLDKQRRLLSAAYTLFTTKGFSKTTIADIVEKANVAKGTFYLYFQDKFEIQDYLISHKTSELFEHALVNSDYQQKSTAADKFIAIIFDLLSQMEQDPELVRFVSVNVSWSVFRKVIFAPITEPSKYRTVLEDILATDNCEWDHPDLLVFTLIQMASSTSQSIILDNDPCSLSEYKPYLAQSIKAITNSHRILSHE